MTEGMKYILEKKVHFVFWNEKLQAHNGLIADSYGSTKCVMIEHLP